MHLQSGLPPVDARAKIAVTQPHLFCFGLGYSARHLARALKAEGWRVSGTQRPREEAPQADPDGIPLWPFDPEHPLADPAACLSDVTHVLVSAPPGEAGDPVLQTHGDDLASAPSLTWLGYLSTTGVYGDTGGAWVDETDETRPTAARSRRRLAAEQAWQASGLPVEIFRLAGIYGPGRSALDTLRRGAGRRIAKAGQVFSRIHVEDIAVVLRAAIARPQPGAVYNVCDDEPAPPQDVVAYAAGLLGLDPPPEIPFETADLSPMAASFYGDNRRVRNARIKRDLGVTLAHPTYREGLRALLSDV